MRKPVGIKEFFLSGESAWLQVVCRELAKIIKVWFPFKGG